MALTWRSKTNPSCRTADRRRSRSPGAAASISGATSISTGRCPDPERVVSGKHCEIRYYDGGFWLHDLSRNGTFVNGSDRRLHEPHRLRNGDRLEIGNYIISVRIDGAEAEPPPRRTRAAAAESPARPIWEDDGESAPPIPTADLRPAKEAAPREQTSSTGWSTCRR